MKALFYFLLAVNLLSPAFAIIPVKTEWDANFDLQTRMTQNSSEARSLGQNWSHEPYHLMVGNIGAKLSYRSSRFEINWFNRYAESELYENNYFAPQFFNFPNKLIARDVFKLVHRSQSQNGQFESLINKAFYEWDYDDSRFAVGRLFINYGLGEIFNPLNPFNQPTGLTSLNNVAQGSDGFKVTIFSDPDTTWNFYLIGDKQIEQYEGKIDRTSWLHAEFRLSDRFQLDGVLGRDQDRHKVGFQPSYQDDQSLYFAQILYQTENIDKDVASTHLWDVMLGFDRQIIQPWHIRFEGGHQKTDPFINLSQASQFNGRFLPYEYFASLANEYEFHPLLKGSLTLIHDIKTHYGYGLARMKYSLAQDWETDIFAFSPVYRNGERISTIQKLFTTDIGLSLRAFF